VPVPDTVVVGFPLRGELWMAANSPGDLVPSHGTDLLGQRYAYDFLQVDRRRKLRYHPAGTLRTLLLGVPTVECYAWGEPVLSPGDGEVVAATDGASGRRWVHPIGELALALWNGMVFRPSRLPKLLGNHVVLRIGEVYAAFAHLATGSVAVAPGDQVQADQLLGRVGHTGNSTAPHLHFQLMDSADPLTARGVPCSFEEYDVLRDQRWERVTGGVPRRGERIRSVVD
jgi:murein DD-endopeptidase MepM/ murein hydrolase activator NlpD